MSPMPHSACSSRKPWLDTMSHIGTPAPASTSIRRTAYGAPDAPVIASTTGSCFTIPRSPFTVHRSPFHAVKRSTSANANTVTLITAFIVKNAASSFDRSSARTS